MEFISLFPLSLLYVAHLVKERLTMWGCCLCRSPRCERWLQGESQCGPNKEPDVLMTDNTALCGDLGIFQAFQPRVNSRDVNDTQNRFEICKDFLDCVWNFYTFLHLRRSTNNSHSICCKNFLLLTIQGHPFKIIHVLF